VLIGAHDSLRPPLLAYLWQYHRCGPCSE
jgi:hypothetical protein